MTKAFVYSYGMDQHDRVMDMDGCNISNPLKRLTQEGILARSSSSQQALSQNSKNSTPSASTIVLGPTPPVQQQQRTSTKLATHGLSNAAPAPKAIMNEAERSRSLRQGICSCISIHGTAE